MHSLSSQMSVDAAGNITRTTRLIHDLAVEGEIRSSMNSLRFRLRTISSLM
jgi:hypothetical protein